MSQTEDLPTFDDMHDTLAFVWQTFFDQLEELWRATPGAVLETSYGGEPVRMRYRALPDTGAGELDFVELQIGDQRSDFVARAILTAPAVIVATDARTAPSMEWSSTGDYDAFIAWMVPWVSRVINEGGGWIEVP